MEALGIDKEWLQDLQGVRSEIQSAHVNSIIYGFFNM